MKERVKEMMKEVIGETATLVTLVTMVNYKSEMIRILVIINILVVTLTVMSRVRSISQTRHSQTHHRRTCHCQYPMTR